MSSFKDCLEIRSTIQFMSRIVPNYKKNRKDKFTASKTKIRIDQLREHWQTCCKLHINLLQVADKDDSSDNYFKNDEIGAAETLFEESLDFLTSLFDKLELRAPPAADQRPASPTFLVTGHRSCRYQEL